MFCMISHGQTSAEKIEPLVRLHNEQVIPLASKQEGFKGIYLLVQPTGSLMLLNLWETKIQAASWLQNPEHQQMATQITSLLGSDIMREGFEVRGHSVPG